MSFKWILAILPATILSDIFADQFAATENSAEVELVKLKSKTAVVTGSSRGIGKAIALELARAGANVILWGSSPRSVDRLSDLSNELSTLHVESTTVICDLSERADLARAVEECWGWKDGIDIWVNNAGVDVLTGENAAMDFYEKLNRLWQVDVVGTMMCSRQVGQRMKSRGQGTIVNIGWDQAWQGMEGDSGEMFAAIKGSVMAFSKSLAKSLAPEVRVNCVAPGWIKTAWGDDASDYWQERATSESLRNRWGTPDDIAKCVRFLSSDESDFINGQIVPVNGGFRSRVD